MADEQGQEQQQPISETHVPMLDPDNNAVYVPTAKTFEQVKKGYKVGAIMSDPDGNKVVVPHDRMGEMLSSKKYKPWVEPKSTGTTTGGFAGGNVTGANLPSMTPAQLDAHSKAIINSSGTPYSKDADYGKQYTQLSGLGKAYNWVTGRGYENTPRLSDDLARYAQNVSESRQSQRTSKAYYDAVQQKYNEQVAADSKEPDPDRRKMLLKLAQEERDARLGTTDAAIEQFAPNAMQTALRMAKGGTSKENAALGVTAAAIPESRLPIGLYYAITGEKSAWQPQQPDETYPDYLERILTGHAAAVGGAALTGATRSSNANQPNTLQSVGNRKVNYKETLPEHHEAMASLLDTNAGKVDPMETSKLATPVMRNEAAKAGLTKADFKGDYFGKRSFREGGKLGYQMADNGIESHQGEIDSISQPSMKDKVDLRPIGKAIRSEITTEMKNNAPEQAQRIENEAKNFDRDGTIEELNDYRKRSNKEQQSFYRGNQSKQIMSEADVAASVKGANAARAIQHEAIGNRAGVDPAYLKKLFDEEGALIEARNSLSKEYNNASKSQAIAKSQTIRESLFGQKGKVSVADAKAQIAKGLFGIKPMKALNIRLSRAFSKLGDVQPYVRPPAPGGSPTVGPNRPMLPAGNPPGIPMPPSSLQGPKGLLPPPSFENIQLHQPPVEAPMQVGEAGRMSGRDVETGKFKRGYTTAPRTPFEEQMINQFPGTVQHTPFTKPAPDTISQKRFNAIMDDIARAAQQRQSPNQPVPVKDSVFQHIKEAQKAQETQQAPVEGQQTQSSGMNIGSLPDRFKSIMMENTKKVKDIGKGEIIHPDDIYDPESPHFIGDDPYYFGDPNNTDPTKGFVSNIKHGDSPRTIEGTIIPKGQKALQESFQEKRVQYPDFREEFKKLDEDEQVRGHFISENTGLPNAKAFNVAENNGKAGAYARSDADGLKLFNDTYGYAAGTELLKAKVEALKEAGLEAYHEKGDEFMYRGNSEGDLRIKLENARRILRDRVFEVTDQQTGKVYHLKNLDFSYGTGGTLDAAEAAQHTHKTAREAAGERGRGKLGSIIKTDQGAPDISEGTPTQEAIKQLPDLRDYANKVVNKGTVKEVSLVGGTTKGALGRDTDIVYDFGNMKLPSDAGAAEEAVEKLIESEENIDLDKHDTFIKADGRYFHVSSGAGRQVIENTDYGKAQEGKPKIVLASKK